MWLSLASGLLLLSAPLDARTSRGWSTDEVLNQLRSTEALEVAWAAREAGLRHLKPAVGPLLDVLESPPEDVDSPVLEHVLDALIQLGAELQPVHLQHLAEPNHLVRTQLLVLAARTPERFESSLLAVLDASPRGAQFHATVSLLTQLRSRGLAHRLLPRLRTELTVTVLDPGDDRFFLYGLGCGGFGTSGGGGRISGWPPSFDYELVYSDDVELASGERRFPVVSAPRAISAIRRLRTPRHHDSGAEPRQREVVAHLVHLAGLPAKSLRIREFEEVKVEYRDQVQLERFVAEQKDRITSEHTRLRESLATQGLLDRARWKETELELEVKLEDERTDKALPLSP